MNRRRFLLGIALVCLVSTAAKAQDPYADLLDPGVFVARRPHRIVGPWTVRERALRGIHESYWTRPMPCQCPPQQEPYSLEEVHRFFPNVGPAYTSGLVPLYPAARDQGSRRRPRAAWGDCAW